ncbi:MAG: glycosyltransferase family 2 protein [Proteobacteria bacterium]|nr:glycosyltransferase family 2 protein [Pseudomonadota bacterium]
MSQQNLVSIIMPAYNADKYIRDGIESVLSQTYQEWELLIVNDCSQDSTAKIVEEYCAQDDRIKFYHNEENSGPAMTRNNAINRAKGRFIAFLDSDDIWLPEKLDKQVSAMMAKRYPFTYTGYHRISEDGMIAGRRISVPEQLNYSQLLRNTAIVTSSVVLDIDAVGKIKMKNTYYDDYACWLDVMKRGIVAHCINEDLVEYRVASSSVSRNKINSAIQVWKTYRSIERLGLLTSAWCFAGYALNALQKYKKF